MRTLAAVLLLASTGWLQGGVTGCPAWAPAAVVGDGSVQGHAPGHGVHAGGDTSAAPEDGGVAGHVPAEGHSDATCTVVMACGSAVLGMVFQAAPELASPVRVDGLHTVEESRPIIPLPQDPPPPRRLI